MKMLVLTSEPVSAVCDAVRRKIVVFSYAPDDQLHGEEVATAELREPFGLPVDRTVVQAAD